MSILAPGAAGRVSLVAALIPPAITPTLASPVSGHSVSTSPEGWANPTWWLRPSLPACEALPEGRRRPDPPCGRCARVAWALLLQAMPNIPGAAKAWRRAGFRPHRDRTSLDRRGRGRADAPPPGRPFRHARPASARGAGYPDRRALGATSISAPAEAPRSSSTSSRRPPRPARRLDRLAVYMGYCPDRRKERVSRGTWQPMTIKPQPPP